MIQSTTITTEAKISSSKATDLFLTDYSGYYSHLKRKLYNEIFHVEKLDKDFRAERKRFYIAEYKISARMFNALWSEAKGMYDSSKELFAENVKTMKRKLKRVKSDIKKLSKKLNNTNLKFNEVKEIKQSLHLKNQEKNKLSDRIKSSKLKPVVFGGKSFYKKQWNAEDHDKWLKEWRRKRGGNMFFIGASCETKGNQLCQYCKISDKEYLQIRIPGSMEKKYKTKYINIPVKFTSERKKEYYSFFQKAISDHKPVSYRFIQRENGNWYVQASFTLEDDTPVAHNGFLGVDINYGLVATSEVDHNGNYIGEFKNYNYDSKNKTSEQTKQTISGIVCDIVKRAVMANRDVVIEDLDLEKKKSGSNKTTNRKVSSIEYSIFKRLMISKCVKEKVYLRIVNPAYTSVIGKYKYSKRYGLSIHNSAAIVIARRGNYYFKGKKIFNKNKERVPIQMVCVLRSGEGKWEKIYRHRHHWAHWKFLSSNLTKCLNLFNSVGSSNRAISMNNLMVRLDDRLSFLIKHRKEYFSI